MNEFYTDWNSLAEDLDINESRMKEDDSMTNRRNFIRSQFALFEATLTDFRETVAQLLVSHYDISGNWSVHKLAPLMDESPRPGKNGKLDLDPIKSPFQNVLAYTFSTAAKIKNKEESFFSDHRWDSFGKAVKVRHRITHPKRGENLDISDEDLRLIYDARDWFNDTLKTIKS